jgi:protein-disulfide isomerase
MASGKKSREKRRAALAAPPPVRSKGGPRKRQASRRAIAIGAGIVVIVAVAIGLAIAFTGGSGGGVPKNVKTVGSAATGLPGSPEVAAMYKGIPQKGLELGSSFAPVQMVMYIDLQCPICQEFETTVMPGLVAKYIQTGKVRLEVKPWAFLGPDSTRGQKAMFAAAEQNKAFQFAQVLYDNQGTENTGWLTDNMLIQIAGSVTDLNVPKLMADRNSSTIAQQINDVSASAKADKVTGTPTVFVGHGAAKPALVGSPGAAPDLAQTEAAIDAALAA